MVEREMQELLWEHPEKLLNEPLAKFRWEASSPVGRADLVFTDRLDRLLVVEVKKGALPRGAIDQLHDYFGMVKREFPDQPVELMVVANRIPEERRLACEKYEIEAREIPEKKFRDVAQEVGYELASEKQNQDTEIPTAAGEVPAGSRSMSSESNQYRSKRERVTEILQDGQCHTAAELRRRLNVQAINQVLHGLARDGVIELRKTKRGNEAVMQVPDPAKLAAEFEEEMYSTYREAKRVCKYNATRFLQMLGECGGVETARRLLATGSAMQTGLEELWLCNRLDLSVEAKVLLPKYQHLFSHELRRTAAERLRAYERSPGGATL
jgi:hypothetical protein